MRRTSMLLLPPRNLASCIAVAVVRDTRSVSLTDKERFNHFPATPLVSLTRVLAGALKLVPATGDLDAATDMPSPSVTPPQRQPLTSWSEGPIAAVTIGFYPDAWMSLGHDLNVSEVPSELAEALEVFGDGHDPETGWTRFCEILEPIWRDARPASLMPDWVGTNRLYDWSRALLARAALGGPGRSTRSIERRLRRWSGHTRQTLDFYSKVENLYQKSTQAPETPLAELACDVGYADQSHMGRAVRRVTGFSPAELNRRIEKEEGFWCYRLIGESF